LTDKIAILTENAPAPAHSFSQAVRKGPIIQISGQGPVDPATNEYIHPGDLTGQTHRTLQNILAIADAAGASFADIVMLRVYLTTRDDFAEMNDAYQDFVTKHSGAGPLPCRTTVITGLPREEMLIEIDALAVVS
jgi:2-iminobutanoate/2-iminopropanoate deaminase